MSEYVYRLSYSQGGRHPMVSLGATTPREAASDVERLLMDGAESVEVERVAASTVKNVEDVWDTSGFFARHAAPVAAAPETDDKR